MQTSDESVDFTFKFTAKNCSTNPVVEIKHNGKTLVEKIKIVESTTLKLSAALPINIVDSCRLEIIRSGFDGVNEQLLNLDEFWIDDINVKELCHLARFYPVYPEPWFSEQKAQGVDWPEYHHGWTTWGWNGTWVLDYQTPIYTWLLKNV